MRKELDDALCTKYPKLFRDRHADMSQTCMCWGFDCGDGWYNLLDSLCGTIQTHIDNRELQIEWTLKHNAELEEAAKTNFENWPHYFSREPREIPESIDQVVVTQVKEKFGSLRFYYNGGDSYIDGAVMLAESMSTKICEVCGAPGIINDDSGWLRARCEEHLD